MRPRDSCFPTEASNFGAFAPKISVVTTEDFAVTDSRTAPTIDVLEARIQHLRRTEVLRWADAVAEGARLADEVLRMKETVSWRVTAPLRAVRRRQLGI